MKRLFLTIIGCILVAHLSGCALCCSPYFDDYPNFGGRIQRSNAEWGRVGSVFSDPYMAGNSLSADSNLEQYELDPPRRNSDTQEPSSDSNDFTDPAADELPKPILDDKLPAPKTQTNSPSDNLKTIGIGFPRNSEQSFVAPSRQQNNQLRRTYR